MPAVQRNTEISESFVKNLELLRTQQGQKNSSGLKNFSLRQPIQRSYACSRLGFFLSPYAAASACMEPRPVELHLDPGPMGGSSTD